MHFGYCKIVIGIVIVIERIIKAAISGLYNFIPR